MKRNDFSCKICGNTQDNTSYMVREMMFGLKEEFEYVACNKCDCLQIAQIPADMARFYPKQYPAFAPLSIVGQRTRDNALVRSLRHARTLAALEKKSIAGKFLLMLKPLEKQLSVYLEWFRKCGIGFDSRILDVGCGEGKLLLELSWYGFRDLTGIDRYIEKDIVYDKGVRIFKNELGNQENVFDLIMFHHSFEHMDEPARILQAAARALSPEGRLLIRIPTVSSYAWKEYGVSWVQIDAPRHFFLYSLQNLEMLAGQAGLTVEEVTFDSTDFQFWGSEQYRAGIPLVSEMSYSLNPARSIFSADDIKAFREKAASLNRSGQGDQICVYLSKKKRDQ